MYRLQAHQAAKKQGMNGRLAAFAESGYPGLVFRNVRPDAAEAQRDATFREENFEGTRIRIDRGVHRERLA